MTASKPAPARTLRARILNPSSPTEATYIDDGVVSYDGAGTIVAVAPFEGQTVDDDLRPGLITPGFVDAHIHFPQCRIIGQAAGPLLRWLDETVFPEEARFADGAYASEVAADFCGRLARAGTTLSMVYGSSHAVACSALFEQAANRGLRMMAGPVLMDRGAPEALLVPTEEALPRIRSLAAQWHGAADGLLQVIVVPRFALSCTVEMLHAAGDLARELGLWVSTHLSENPAECEAVVSDFGVPDYLAVYERAGLVHRRSVLAHCIHLSPGEWERLHSAEAVVAHCPDSNAFLGSGGMDIALAFQRAGAVAMGSDVAAGRSFRIPAALAHAHDNALQRGADLTMSHLFWLGTRGGALALGQPDVGALEVGLDADLVLHRVPQEACTADRVLGHLLFDRDEQGALQTWVRGRSVWSSEIPEM